MSVRIEYIGRRGGRALWRLTDPFAFWSPSLRPWFGLEPMVMPAGFKTDFASVPLGLLWLTTDTAHLAALPHDYLTQFHEDFQDADERPIPRDVADAVFLEAMVFFNDPAAAWRRRAMWMGVRAGGWVAWNDHARRRRELNPHLTPVAPEAP